VVDAIVLSELLRPLEHPTGAAWDDVRVLGLSEDSRRIEPGFLFVAIPGTVLDGAAFADEAVSRGAVAVVAEQELSVPVPSIVVPDVRRALALLSARFYGNPTVRLHTIGVTGTNGKTTVCHWAAHLLGTERVETITTVENERRGLRAVTTPSSPIVQRIAREALDAGKCHLIVEASSIGLAQERLRAIGFDIAAFTNLSHDHLDLHGSLEAYVEAKLRLFRGLAGDARAVVRVDDPCAEAVLEASTGQPFTVGRLGQADLTAGDVVLTPDGVSFRLMRQGVSRSVRLPTLSLESVDNALVAAGIALCAGLDLETVADRLETVPPVAGRGVVFRNPDGGTAVVDFAHNPAALEALLSALRGRFSRVVALFGCPGGSDRSKRPRMGEISGRLADWTVLTSDNPKDESPEAILDEIAVGLRAAEGRWEAQVDRAAAVRRGVELAGTDGVLLVAGKGHETYQIVGTEFVPYADEAVLLDLGFERAARPSKGA